MERRKISKDGLFNNNWYFRIGISLKSGTLLIGMRKRRINESKYSDFMDCKLENNQKQLKQGFIEYLESLCRYWNMEINELQTTTLVFWRKRADFGTFQRILVYSSLQFVESVLFDSKSHTNILQNRNFMGFVWNYGTRMKELEDKYQRIKEDNEHRDESVIGREDEG